MKILHRVPSAHFSSLRAGGTVEQVYLPQTIEELVRLLRQQENLPLLGRGSNTLICQRQPAEAIICTRELDHIEETDGQIIAKSGVMLPRLATYCARRGYQGFAPLAGIPGTLGGALTMNAGCYGVNISDKLVWIELLEQGAVVRRQPEQLDFAYRHSSITPGLHTVLRAAFRLESGDPQQELSLLRNSLHKKKSSQPSNLPSLGSVFRNPPSRSAWQLIQSCGMQGFTLGGMEISPRHANFIVNSNAPLSCADDYLLLARYTAQRVYNHYGIRLMPEFRYLNREGWNHADTLF
ncbi:UDP-N-acetylmuramate dehydrogenase [Desulfurispira natronophila]|uniref:UDP-N-acetylenolpyruvoylglucosamine reductase n=1 Tax=Desulfurispira natronophila TaxID=682562 RepID=A0A7W7Y3T4_9BACT|nr:UDP-N-acetylmuramate dehydrogenase [Desulfurispira natronophila]MBB5021297.1 UDP-N-acetylmuramate dehydrogenase [Desulfurispira natronophila]